jgi:hypothetical protein
MAETKIKEKEAQDQFNEEDALFRSRKSVELTKENAIFKRSEGGLISLTLLHETGEREVFERIVPVRAFPISDPDDYISIREPDSKDHGKGLEIGMITHLPDLDKDTVALITEELDKRYFTPELLKIYSTTEKFGYLNFDAETSAGRVSFVMVNPYSNFRTLEDGRVFIYDIDGNCFRISDPQKLDRHSFRMIEIYL